jgi:hypothetical protein
VALCEGSGRVEGRLVSLRRVTALRVHYPAKSRIIDVLVSSSYLFWSTRDLTFLSHCCNPSLRSPGYSVGQY